MDYQESLKDKKARRRHIANRMGEIASHIENHTITPDERAEYDRLSRSLKAVDGSIGAARNSKRTVKESGVEGRSKEILSPGQSATAWLNRAAENGLRMENDHAIRAYDPEYLNDWWGARLGFRSETRALGEDTSGSGLAITPQAWTAQFVDYLYPNTVAGKLGVSRMMMQAEQVNVPQFTAPVQPAWIAENTATSLDANPAFSSVVFLAKGMFYDITLYSMELAQDAYIQGGLPGMLAASAAKNYAVGIDSSMLYGVTGNSGNPGLNQETGVQFRKYGAHTGTTGQSPADTTDVSVLAELVRDKNAEPSGILASPQAYGTVSRLNASTYAKYWDEAPDVANLPWVYSTTVPVTETDPALGTVPAQTGGTFTSIYCGDWSRVVMGVHLELQTTVLKERYADQLQFGLLTYMRYSIRTTHPETFVRDYGIVWT